MKTVQTRTDRHAATVPKRVRVARWKHRLARTTGWNRTAIAKLTPPRVAKMSNSELARVIRAAHLALLRKGLSSHLEMYDRDTLERLVYAARRCCRNQGF